MRVHVDFCSTKDLTGSFSSLTLRTILQVSLFHAPFSSLCSYSLITPHVGYDFVFIYLSFCTQLFSINYANTHRIYLFLLFSHAVCTTELGKAALLAPEFDKRNVKMIALSCDSVEEHIGWIKDIAAHTGGEVKYPIIADENREVANLLGMLDMEEMVAPGLPATVRKVFIIGPDHRVKLQLVYPTAVGRNFDEILRVIDALQLSYKYPIATPVNWCPKQKVMIQPFVTADDAKEKFPDHEVKELPSGKHYLRMTSDPSA